jgi:hypothetical protein
MTEKKLKDVVGGDTVNDTLKNAMTNSSTADRQESETEVSASDDPTVPDESQVKAAQESDSAPDPAQVDATPDQVQGPKSK